LKLLVLVVLLMPVMGWCSEVGNGGDVVYCEKSEVNPFFGHMSLDYLATFQRGNNNEDVIDVDSWEISRHRILSVLDKKHPGLAKSFRLFLSFRGNSNDYSLIRVWEESGFGLTDLKDESLVNRLPENCLNVENGEPKVIQAVIRQAAKYDEFIVYKFDPRILDHLSSPLQLSFLLVHEWLWDTTKDVESIRRFNRILHSEAAETMSKEKFEIVVSRLNLGVRPNIRTGVYRDDRGYCEVWIEETYWGGIKTDLNCAPGYGLAHFSCSIEGGLEICKHEGGEFSEIQKGAEAGVLKFKVGSDEFILKRTKKREKVKSRWGVFLGIANPDRAGPTFRSEGWMSVEVGGLGIGATTWSNGTFQTISVTNLQNPKETRYWSGGKRKHLVINMGGKKRYLTFEIIDNMKR